MNMKKGPGQRNDGLLILPVLNLVCLLIPFLLLTATFLSYAMINVTSPPFNPAPGPPQELEKEFDLTLLVTDRGFFVSLGARTLPGPHGPRGEDAETGPTIPMGLEDGEPVFDYAGLTARMREIKDENPDQTKIRIGAEKSVRYEEIVRVMDATREDDEGALFPDVIMIGGIL